MANKTQEVTTLSIVMIQSDMDSLVEEIKGIDQEIEMLRELFKLKMSELENKFNDKEYGLQNKKEYLLERLRYLFEQVPTQETKTQRKCMLLHGDVVVKNATKKIAYDKDKLLDWAIANKKEALIDKKEITQFKWSEFKRNLAVQEGFEEDGIVDTSTGEILRIDGLSVVYVKEKIEVK